MSYISNHKLQFSVPSAADIAFVPAPIRPDTILAGAPVARSALLSVSGDRTVSSMAWDCTAGHFHWQYAEDEWIVIVDGDVRVRLDGGQMQSLCAGDTFFFPSGSSAVWEIDSYVRKVAFLHRPLPWAASILTKIIRKSSHVLQSRFGGKPVGNSLG